MSPDLLHVVAVISNPMRTASRPALYRTFCEHMLDSGVQLTTVECALGERPFEVQSIGAPHVNFVGVRNTTIVWHKESLINIGIAHLPKDARYIAWIDADITFRSPTWASDTVHALQQFSIIQPWEHCYDLGPKGEHLELHTSFGALYRQNKPIFPTWKHGYTFAHPGFSWAARRELLDNIGGLFDKACLGSADHNMALAMLGRVKETFPSDISPQFTEALLAWQSRAEHFVGGRIGYLPGTIMHNFHGSKKNRFYVSRWDILKKWKFNPVTDLRYNLDQVIELAQNKPGLQHDIESYFSSRMEDSNTP